MSVMRPLVGEHWRVRGRLCFIKKVSPEGLALDEAKRSTATYLVVYQQNQTEETITDELWVQLNPWGPYY
jgi:hypothetical protein